MNYYNKILILWICAIAAVALFWGVVIYENGSLGEIKLKKEATQTLREVSELVVSHDFERLGLSYSRWGAKKKHTKRLAITEKGKFEVLVDSLKEAQGLYPLEAIGYKADMLNCYGKFPLERILYDWKKRMGERCSKTEYALSLNINPLGTDAVQEYLTGNKTICLSQHKLGTYYLNEMYTMTLTVYMLPTFWSCVDWTAPLLMLTSCILFALLLGLLFWIRVQHSRNEKTINTLPQGTYQFGKYIFDIVKHTLTYKNEEISCTPQAAKLLFAFATAPDYLLTNDNIAATCGWSLGDDGLNERRRKAINLLRKLFEADDSIKITALPARKAYQLVISE